MRYKRAVEKLRVLAETCERVKTFWFDTEPFLKAVYAFGEVVDGADPLDTVQVAVVINLSPEEVPWESSPEGTDWLANEVVRPPWLAAASDYDSSPHSLPAVSAASRRARSSYHEVTHQRRLVIAGSSSPYPAKSSSGNTLTPAR
jgi:hypothetical protein